MGAAAGVIETAHADWSEEEVVQQLLPIYVKQPEKCLRVHNALVQLVMLEKERLLSAKNGSAHIERRRVEDEMKHEQLATQEVKEKLLLAKKERLEREIEKRCKISLRDRTNIAGESSSVKRISEDVAQVISALRADPTSFLPHVQNHLNSFVDEFSYKDPFNRPNTTIRTQDGRRAVLECMQYLQSADPTLPIAANRCLENAAVEYASGIATAVKQTNVSLGDAVKKHGHWRGVVGQTVSYGNDDIIAIVLSLLIDDGSADRSHRQSIFEPQYLQVGAALTKHDQQGYCCVIHYATAIVDWSTQQTDDTIASFSRWNKNSPEHNEDLFRKVLSSIPNDGIEKEVHELLEPKGAVVTINFQPSYSRATILQTITTSGSKSTTTLTVTWGSKIKTEDGISSDRCISEFHCPSQSQGRHTDELPSLSKFKPDETPISKSRVDRDSIGMQCTHYNLEDNSRTAPTRHHGMWTPDCAVVEQPWRKLSGTDTRPIRVQVNDRNSTEGPVDPYHQILVYDMRKPP